MLNSSCEVPNWESLKLILPKGLSFIVWGAFWLDIQTIWYIFRDVSHHFIDQRCQRLPDDILIDLDTFKCWIRQDICQINVKTRLPVILQICLVYHSLLSVGNRFSKYGLNTICETGSRSSCLWCYLTRPVLMKKFSSSKIICNIYCFGVFVISITPPFNSWVDKSTLCWSQGQGGSARLIAHVNKPKMIANLRKWSQICGDKLCQS